jgi:hypothetical protein
MRAHIRKVDDAKQAIVAGHRRRRAHACSTDAHAHEPPRLRDLGADVERWLKRNSFFCPKLSARLTPEACVERQSHKMVMVRVQAGTKFRKHDDPLNRWCASGRCGLGQRVKEKLVKLKGRGGRS